MRTLTPGLLIKGKKLPVGHISTWADGNQYKKTAPGKWEPVAPIAAPEPGAGGAAWTAIAREDAVLVEAWSDVKRSLRDAPAKSPSAARRRITEALLAAGEKANAPWAGDHWAVREVSESELVPVVPSVEHPGGWELQLPQGWASALSSHQPSPFRPDISWQGEAFFRGWSEEMRLDPAKTEKDARARMVAGILVWSGTGNSQGVWGPERARLAAARAPLVTDSHGGWYLGWPGATAPIIQDVVYSPGAVPEKPPSAPPVVDVDDEDDDEEEESWEDEDGYSEGEWADDEGLPEGWSPDRTGPDWSRLSAIATRLKEQKLERLSSRVAETYGRDQWESAVRFAVDRWTDGGQKAIRAAVDETDGKDGVFRDVMVALAASGDVHEELYRGTNWPLQRILDLARDVAAGQSPEFEIRSPASFTSNYDASEWFANHDAKHLPVVIRVRNARGVYLGEMSEFGNEDEVVTAITKARVVGVETAGWGPALDAMITIEALEYAMAKSTRSADDLSRLLDEEFDLPLDHREPRPPKPGLRKGQLGSEKPGHLWHRREGSPGHYRYFYRDAQGKEFASDSATPPKAPKEQADIKEYKLQVEGKGAADVADKMKRGIQQAADLCQTNPPLCKDNLGIPRSEMPQLTKDIQDHFLHALVVAGVTVLSTQMPVGKMKATQREINAEKVNGMVEAVKAGKLNLDHGELVVSKDGYILDGHHRWAALTTMDPGKSVRVQRVDLPMHEMLARSLKHPGVTTAGFGQMNKSILVVLPGVPIAEPDPYPALIRPLTRPQRPGFPFVGTIELPDLPPIDIENPAGTIRQCGECAYPMHAHYGEFRHTEGADGDAVDVFVLQGCAWTGLGSHAWIVHAADPATGDYDEDKVILGTGWMDERGIRDEFIRQYNGSERHFFAASRCTIEELATLLQHPHTKGEMLLPWNGEDGLAKGGSFPIGTVRTWKDGLKYRKLADGVWEALPGQGKPAASASPASPAQPKPAKKLTTKQKASLKAKEAATKAKIKKAKDALAAAKAKVQARKKALAAAKVRLAAKKKAYASAKKKKDAAKRAAAWEGVLSATAAHQAALAAHGAAKMGVLAKREALAALTGKKVSAPAGATWSAPPSDSPGVPHGWGRVHTLATQLQAADARAGGEPIGAEHIVKALKSWTGGAQKSIRQANIGVAADHRAVLQKLVEHAGETGLTMLRGTRMPAHIRNALKPGHEISLRGLASFSMSDHTARSFAGSSDGVILDLRGARGLKVAELSKYKTEHEVICSITKARVTSITAGPPVRITLQAAEGVMAKSDLGAIQQWFDDEFDKPAHRKPGPTPGGGVIPAVPWTLEMSKGKRFAEGTVRTWSDGKQYRKTADGWRPTEAAGAKPEPKERKTVRVTRTRKDGTEFVMHIRDKETIARVAHEKHERVVGLARQLPTILKNIKEDASQGHQPSIVAWMIAETGMRVGGGKRDAPGKTGTTQTFGATTLQAKHIHVAQDGAVSIRYQGKKAVQQHHDIEDRDLARAVRTLAMNAPKPTARIFTDAARRDVAAILKRYDPAFQVKDLRTAVALSEAAKAVARLQAKPPKDQRQAVFAIGKAVSQRLGNTPDVAIRDYVGPTFLEDALLKLGYTAKAEDYPLLRSLFGSAQVDAWLAAYVDESEEEDNDVTKAWPPKKAGPGPFIGPKGGKWADPQHTVSWKPAVPGATGVIAAKDPHGITHYDPATGKKRKKGGSIAPIDIEHYDWSMGADDDTPSWRGRPLDATAPAPEKPKEESLMRRLERLTPAQSKEYRRLREEESKKVGEALDIVERIKKATVIPALVIDLEKGATPGGKGWERIPKGKKGGFRRHTGKQGRAYEYFYPGQPSSQAKHGWEPDPAKGPKNAKPGDIVFVVGRNELFRLTPEHGPTETGRTWVHSASSGKYTLIFKDKLRPARRRTQPQSAPSKTPTKPGKLPPPPPLPPSPIKPPKPEFTKPPTAKHSKPFKDTQQEPGTVLHRIESGQYLLQRHWDADRRKSHWGIYVPPGDERQFFDEMKPIIFGAAKKIGRRYGIQMKQADGSKTIAAENLISASTMGVVMSLSSYTGGRPFAPGAWGYALSYAGNQARTEMGAGANITVRQMRMLKGFLAAKMRQGAKLDRDPTPDEIAKDWTVIKKDVFQGRLGSYTKDGTTHHQDRQKVPADDWQVLDAKGNPTGKHLPGTKKLAVQMAELAQGNKVEDSEWAGFRTGAMEQDFGHLPLGEASARRDRVDAILGAVARINDQWAQALMMKFGLDDPGGTPATGTEIADALQIRPGDAEPTRRKAAGALLTAALAQFQHEAKRLEAGDIASAARRWVKAPDAAPPSTPGHPTGRSWNDIVESVGPERAAILSAGIRGGRADWAEDILARERDGKATADESRNVRIFRAEVERREAIVAFQAHAQTWSPAPGETRDVNPEADTLTFRRVGGGPGTADFPPVGPHGPQGPAQVPVPGSPRYEPAEADVGGKKPASAKEPHVAFVGDPEIHRMRYLQALYQVERSIPGARTPEQVQRILGRGPQPRQAGRREHPTKKPKKGKVAKAVIPGVQLTRRLP